LKNLKDFQKNLFCRYVPQSGREKVPPHIKTFTRHNGNDAAWFLVTSSNLSKAAWGELQKSGSQMLIRNYEIGVLLLPSRFECDRFSLEFPTKEKTSKHVPTPYTLPLASYRSGDEPWVWDIKRSQPDIFGNTFL
jgi:tyrosyl-DNA phosphodiesterase-1